MTVRIEIFGETAREALDELRGFADDLIRPASAGISDLGAAEVVDRVTESTERMLEAAAVAEEAPKRERGKPAPGRARRTKEEIAEDEAAAAAEFAPEAKKLAEEGAQQFAEDRAAMNITAEPENRVDPADAAQDAEDEAADEANAPAPEATRDDVRAAMLAYQAAYGTPALMADMTAILNEEYPAGGVTKLSEIPDTSADFARITARLNDALANNTFSRDKV